MKDSRFHEMTPEEIKAEDPSLTFVYCIRNDDALMAKIGKSHKPLARLRALQTANHNTLRLISIFPSVHGNEGIFHNVFRDRHVRGEWFDDHDLEVSWCMSQHAMKHYGRSYYWLGWRCPYPARFVPEKFLQEEIAA